MRFSIPIIALFLYLGFACGDEPALPGSEDSDLPTGGGCESRGESLRPQQALVFCGQVTIGGEPAPDGTPVQALSGDEVCASTVTQSGFYFLDLPLLRCPKQAGDEVMLSVDGAQTRTVRDYGRFQRVDLRVQ